MSENTLARRLTELTASGVLRRTQYSLTEQGRALVPVLAALAAWGNEWTGPDPDPDLPKAPARPSWLDENTAGVAERRS